MFLPDGYFFLDECFFLMNISTWSMFLPDECFCLVNANRCWKTSMLSGNTRNWRKIPQKIRENLEKGQFARCRNYCIKLAYGTEKHPPCTRVLVKFFFGRPKTAKFQKKLRKSAKIEKDIVKIGQKFNFANNSEEFPVGKATILNRPGELKQQ